MKGFVTRLRALVAKPIAQARAYAEANPVRVATRAAAIVVGAASLFGLVLDQQTVLQALLIVAAIVSGGEYAHRRVSPVKA